MAMFEVREVFRLEGSHQFVIAGRIAQGVVAPGMRAVVMMHNGASWSLRIAGVEYIDRRTQEQTLIGLVFQEETTDVVTTCRELCAPGTMIEVLADNPA